MQTGLKGNANVGFELLTAMIMKTSVFWYYTALYRRRQTGSKSIICMFFKLKIMIFWVIKPCSSVEVNRHFGATYHLHLHDRIASEATNQQDVSSKQREPLLENQVWCRPEIHYEEANGSRLIPAGFLLGLLIDTGDGADTFLRSVCELLLNPMALLPRGFVLFMVTAVIT
jgi:hypothetical protein